jgi:hypothetical protein
MRRLLCTDRVVPLDRLDEYLALWARVRATAAAAGMRAWIFRAAGHDDQFREFVEWEGAPREETAAARPDVERALRDLEEAFAARGGAEWEEVRP